MQRRQVMVRRKFLTWAAVILLAACGGRKPGDPLKPGFNIFSKEQDIQLGQEAARAVLRQVEVVQNQQLQRYIDQVGGRLAKQPEAGNYPYEFTLINDPSINAFALPGGPIFVNSGLIAAADNEAQLAGVLAHEISHVALRHATSQASKANLLQFPAALAAAMIGQGGVGGQLGQLGLGFGLNVLLLRYSRDAEREADALGARLMANAGYNPIEMARFFEKLEAEGGSRAPQFLSTHPSPGNRVQNVEAEIRTFPRREYNLAADNPQFREAKRMVAQLPQPRQNPQRAAQPSPGPAPAPTVRGFENLNTSRFSISYPQGWNVFGDQQSDSITLAPRAGLVSGPSGGTLIGYGVVIGYYHPARSHSLEEATRELLAQLQSINRGLEVQSGMRNVQAGNSPGAVVTLRGPSPYGGAETDVLVTVARPEGLFYMVFIAPSEHFQQAQTVFEQMLRSLRFA